MPNPISCGRMKSCGPLCVWPAEIRKLNFGRKDTPLLKLLRRVLRESRAIAAAETANSQKLD